MSNTRNAKPATTAPVNASGPGRIDTSDWEDLPIGFDPYWSPEEGKSFIARVVEIDARDPKFIRLRFQAGEDTMCSVGEVDDAKPTLVPAGGFFTISVYAGLEREFVFHLQQSVRDGIATPMCKVTAVGQGKVKTGEFAGKPFWRFNAQTSKADKARLLPHREAYFKALGASTRPALGAVDDAKTDARAAS
jgi:hypothetical protein